MLQKFLLAYKSLQLLTTTLRYIFRKLSVCLCDAYKHREINWEHKYPFYVTPEKRRNFDVPEKCNINADLKYIMSYDKKMYQGTVTQNWLTRLQLNTLKNNTIQSVQFGLSVMSNSATPWTTALEASLSITNSCSLHKFISVESVIPCNHLILCHPLLLLPSIFPSIEVFSNESVLCIRWPIYWSFSFSIGPSNEYSGLISFRMDLSDLLAVQGTFKSLLQHHSSKASILHCSAFFLFQLSHSYMTLEKP